MIRITFVTGAGKLARQKYDENAARTVTSALRSLGYEEDRAASCVVECAGTFKSQHDTGKNLKTIVVFPNIENKGMEEDNGALQSGMDKMNIGSNSSSKLPNGSAEHMCAVSSMQVFTKMLSSKCPSWAQKKGCLAAINSVLELVQSFENELSRGQPLSDQDQDLFDSISVDLLSQKETLVKNEMQQQVEDGKLIKSEKEMLLAQVTAKLAKVEEESKNAKKENKPKKLEKLKPVIERLQTRQKKLEDIVPQPPHRLRHEADIVKLRVEMQPLLKLENETKGRLLSMKETKTLSRKADIMAEIEEFEQKSRGWFESDEAFAARVEANRKSSASAAKQKTVKKKTTTSSNSNIVFKKSTTAWVTPGMAKKKKAPVKTKKTGGSGGVFAAMMMDSDSDSD